METLYASLKPVWCSLVLEQSSKDHLTVWDCIWYSIVYLMPWAWKMWGWRQNVKEWKNKCAKLHTDFALLNPGCNVCVQYSICMWWETMQTLKCLYKGNATKSEMFVIFKQSYQCDILYWLFVFCTYVCPASASWYWLFCQCVLKLGRML